MSNVPYTYLIGWTQHNKWYYGVRFAKECHPDDLWVKYFTSSKQVKLLRDVVGEPDVIRVRRIFNSSEKAVLWETKVLRRLRIKEHSHWLNQAEVSSQGVLSWVLKGGHSEQTRQKISEAKKGVRPSNEAIQKFKNRMKGRAPHNKGMPMTEEAKTHLSELNKGKAPGNKGTTVYNDGNRHYYLRPDDPKIIEFNLTKGGLPKSETHKAKISSSLTGFARTEEQKQKHREFRHSEETKRVMSEKRKLHSGPNKGKSPSLETRKRISESLKQQFTDLGLLVSKS